VLLFAKFPALNSRRPNVPPVRGFPGSSVQWRTAPRQGQGRLPWGHPRGAMPGMSIACLEVYFQGRQPPPTALLLGGLPVSTRHHGSAAALVHSHARVRTSDPGEPLQPGNPGYPASPCQTDKAGVSRRGAHGKTPSTIPVLCKGHPSPVPGWQVNRPAGREPQCPMWETGFIQWFLWGKSQGPQAKPQSGDLPSCHQCHRFHVCLSHPEMENRDHEVISKDPSPPRHQPERINGAKAEADLGSFGSS